MATLQSRGSAVASERVNPGLVDPRLLAADYTAILQGAGQGLQLADNFYKQRQLALDREEANAVRDQRMAVQRHALELEPQLLNDRAAVSRAAGLRAANTPIELDSTQSITQTPRFGAPTSVFKPSLDGDTLGTYVTTPNKLPGVDTVIQENVTQIDPVTGERRVVSRLSKPLQTAEQAQAQKDMSEYRADLADAKLRAAQAISDKDAANRVLKERELSDKEKRTNAYVDSVKTKTYAPSSLGRLMQERAAALSNGDANTVALYDAELSNRTNPTGRAFSQLTSLSKTALRTGETLEAYLHRTRNDDGSIKTAGFLGFGGQDLDPDAEKLATRYFQLLDGVTNMATQTPAPGSLPTAAAATLPAASPTRQATQPKYQVLEVK